MRRDLETREYTPATRHEGNGWPISSFPTVGDLFQSFFRPAFLGSNTGVALPSLDLTETGDAYKVEVDVPGYTMDQINVQFVDNVLTLSGEHTTATKTGDGGKQEDCGDRCHIVERTRGSFSRSIKFPVPVDAANVKASLKHGVLTVTVPKGAAAKAQKIKITES
jgi:HSP20 family protein